MDLMMRTGIINSLLCLAGLNSPALCMGQETWKNRKHIHYRDSISRGYDISASEDLVYFADSLIDETDFQAHLSRLLVPRPVGSTNHRLVREHIVNTMRDLGWGVDTPAFRDNTPVGDRTFTNVVATLDPSAPRRMVVACHYDSLIKPEGFLGATDSAVPCAQMLNLAHTLAMELKDLKGKRPRPELTLQFIFFDGEEAFVRWTSTDSIYGSRNLAQSWQNKPFEYRGVSGNHNDRIDIFVLLDLIGARNMEFSKLERSTGDWYDRLVKIERNLKQTGSITDRKTIFKDEFLPAGIEDDHIPFKRLGVPILHLITYPFPKAWHKMGDNEASLDFDRIGSLNKILRVFVAEYLNMNP